MKTMKKDFDFNRIGKRMPYTTPPQCWEEMKKNIWKKVQPVPAISEAPMASPKPAAKHQTFRLRLVLGISAIAASIALLLLVRPASPTTPSVELPQIEQAFAQLNVEDQAYLLDIFEEDIYLNEKELEDAYMEEAIELETGTELEDE